MSNHIKRGKNFPLWWENAFPVLAKVEFSLFVNKNGLKNIAHDLCYKFFQANLREKYMGGEKDKRDVDAKWTTN